jgi:hypothetical protein
MSQPSGPPQTRQLIIEFLFLDLDTCTRCRATDATLTEAVELTRPVLASIGVRATVTKTLVGSEQQARALGFVSSPTIRIDGVDIAGPLLESPCDSCTGACGCHGSVACRDWSYRGERTTQPPAGLIAEAIMRHALGEPAAAGQIAASQVEVSENLHRVFTAPTTRPEGPCCPPEAEASCCEPDQKTACCGTGATPALCGCAA